LNLVKFEPGQSDFSPIVSQALEGEPEYIVCAAFSLDAAKIKKELDKTGSPAKLFFTDAAQTPYLIKALGEDAEGLEGTTPAEDPSTEFATAYETEFGRLPCGFAATTYDAFLLSAYTLARQEYNRKERMEESLEKVVSGRGTKVGWNEMNKAIDLILQGELPDISGASGPLEFDEEFGVDPVATFYSHWKVASGNFRTVETISSGKSSGVGRKEEGASAYRTLASQRYAELLETGKISYIPEERKELWAVIIATDMDWANYRHQSDALAMYDLLRSNGVDDSHIILFLIDDIANNEKNSMKGDVHHIVGGKNLREDALIDFSGKEASIENFQNVLLGNKTTDTPTVLETNEHSDIFLYIVNHGMPGCIPFANGGELKAEDFSQIIEDMYKNKRYRQMFIMVEVCFGESMALDIKTPGVVYFTGASKTEPSFGCNYDPQIKAWLADSFTYQVLSTISKEPNLPISELYTTVYERVAGSHVRLRNYSNFGDIATTSISEFISP
jgi:hypothetical protein